MSTIRKNLARAALALAVLLGGNHAHAASVSEKINFPSATGRVIHHRVKEHIGGEAAYRDDDGQLVVGRRWVLDLETMGQVPDPRDVYVVSDEHVTNVKTTAGIDFLFSQGYNSSAAAQTNGLAWVGLSNDTVTETSASTTLSNEIAANGLTRAKGTYAHTNGASTATITITFTATGAQSCQKAALFSAASSGTMQHVLSFTGRSLVSTDTLQITTTITLS